MPLPWVHIFISGITPSWWLVQGNETTTANMQGTGRQRLFYVHKKMAIFRSCRFETVTDLFAVSGQTIFTPLDLPPRGLECLVTPPVVYAGWKDAMEIRRRQNKNTAKPHLPCESSTVSANYFLQILVTCLDSQQHGTYQCTKL